MAYTTIDNPELYFQIKLYAGTGSAQSVTFDGSEDMQPDWVWGKGRDVANLHALFDSVRGTGKALYTDRTNAEENQAQGVTAFNSEDFPTLDLPKKATSGRLLISKPSIFATPFIKVQFLKKLFFLYVAIELFAGIFLTKICK